MGKWLLGVKSKSKGKIWLSRAIFLQTILQSLKFVAKRLTYFVGVLRFFAEINSKHKYVAELSVADLRGGSMIARSRGRPLAAANLIRQ